MPFHQRSIEPRKLRKPVLFSSLDEVGCHTLTNIIHQLSDLSRHASDIFLGIEMEAGMVFRRSCRIHGRLQRLQCEVRKFDPKNIKIRKCAVLGTSVLCANLKCEYFPPLSKCVKKSIIYYRLKSCVLWMKSDLLSQDKSLLCGEMLVRFKVTVTFLPK
uniref:Uncharacterized protein n=1 Tax=Labrus bergylta TaxID=56723 RepID=A0A3Q3FDL9_9LABR